MSANALTISTRDELAAVVKAVRSYKGWSQRELAKKAGVSQKSISKLEGLSGDVEFGIALKTLGALGVSLEPKMPKRVDRD